MLNNVLMGVQLVLAVFLMLVIMPQESKENFKSDFSGAEEGSQAYFKPKGKEAFLGRVTKIAAVLFFINAIAMLLVK